MAALIYEVAMPSPVGWLGIRTDGSALIGLDILSGRPATAGAPGHAGATAASASGRAPKPAPRPASGPVAQRVAEALARYFGGDRAALADLPVSPAGTPFQERVWWRLSAIPPGETLSYGALARELGTSARAVGGACRANPIPLVIPCHRVVAMHGLGGYSGARAGDWLAKKRWLLAHEGVQT